MTKWTSHTIITFKVAVNATKRLCYLQADLLLAAVYMLAQHTEELAGTDTIICGSMQTANKEPMKKVQQLMLSPGTSFVQGLRCF